MGPIIFILIVFLILSESGMLGSRAVFSGYSNFNPGKAKVQADFRKMTDALKAKREALVPWSDEERSLLSLKTEPYKERTGNVKTAQGTFLSIYHELLAHFAYKRYIGRKENAIMAVLTSHHEFLYRIKADKVEVAFNGSYFGAITPAWDLVRDKRILLAQIKKDAPAEYYPVIVQGREVGSIGDVKRTTKVNPRAFELLSEISPEEEKMLLALAFYFLIRNNFRKI